ncbi:DNA-binding LytR/AlgR family response regulator [Dyadobacter jejuensis]|uniref:DNA-binding LytR/AlgR family response regulator n=1 Tax=Dyadobacter jejuensis TaxID=1082580 RepID=A0A316AIU6_9BACT|nr:LytTR family DNA-binding domain-containing protein [Dyadobacter jejuensis]PWJ57561.1 DNA-binding LytR/AlgR family response regulator [Dyadobacter jejuensis]
MTLVSCIAVDDEPLALGLVCSFIEKTPFLKLVGRYSSAVEALEAIHSQPIDLIFLDIQMPDLTGIELARVIDKKEGKTPKLIFTTAFNHFALEGYKVDALDYLLKPFNYEEFLRAATKAQAYMELVHRAAAPPSPQAPTEEYLYLKVEYQMYRILYDDILYMEGLKDYVKVHLKNEPKPLLSLTSLKSLEDKLPESKFMRIHRSYIVNLDQINAITKNSIQIQGQTIPVSEQYKEAFSQFLSKWL